MIQVPLLNAPDTFALIDDEDTPILAYEWTLSDGGYAVRTVDSLAMHRAVLHVPEGRIVDHIDGDRLNNTRANIRVVTPRQNARNIAEAQRDSFAGFIGVGWHGGRGKWQASIRVDGKLLHLGLFPDIEDAKRARCEAEVLHWGVNPRRKAVLERVLKRTLELQESDGRLTN